MKTPVNGQTLKHHFTYSWWKYLLVLLVGIFVINLLFTVTQPKVPEDKRVDFYIFGYSDADSLNAYMDQVRLSEMPDMESMSSVTSYPDQTYGAMVLTTYMAASEGDLYLLSREDFISYASYGAFLPLENDETLISFFSDAGLDLRRGWRTLSDSDETHLYGIPADLLPGLSSYCYAQDGFLCVTSFGQNDENTLKFLRILCRDMISAPEDAEPRTSSENP